MLCVYIFLVTNTSRDTGRGQQFTAHRSERFNKFCPLLITKNNSQPNASSEGGQRKGQFHIHLSEFRQIKAPMVLLMTRMHTKQFLKIISQLVLFSVIQS